MLVGLYRNSAPNPAPAEIRSFFRIQRKSGSGVILPGFQISTGFVKWQRRNVKSFKNASKIATKYATRCTDYVYSTLSIM